MFSKKIILSVFICIISVIFISEDMLEAGTLFREAGRDYAQNNFDDAISKYTVYLRQEPSSLKEMQSRYMIGKCYMNKRDYAEALRSFERIRRRGRTHEHRFTYLSALYQIGRCNFYLGNYVEAIRFFSEVKNAENRFLRVDSKIGIAMSRIAVGEKEQAAEILFEVLEDFPKYRQYCDVVIPLSLVMIEKEQYSKARGLLEKLPDSEPVKYFRALAYRKGGKINRANALFREIITGDSDDDYWVENAYYQRARAFASTGQYSFVQSVLQEFLEKYPESDLVPRVLFRLSSIEFLDGKYDNASSSFERLMREYGDKPVYDRAKYMWAETRLRQGDYSSALEKFSELKDEDSFSMYSDYKVIWLYGKMQNAQYAVSKADNFLEKYVWGRIAANTHLVKAMKLRLKGEYKRALIECQKLIEKFAGTDYMEKALYLKTVTYFEMGLYPLIVTEIYNILNNYSPLYSEYIEKTYFWVGEAFYKMDEYESAVKVYRMVLDKYPESAMIPRIYQGLSSSYAGMEDMDRAYNYQNEALAAAERIQDEAVAGRSVLEMANILFNRGEYDRVISYLIDFVEDNPQSSRLPDALMRKAEAMYRLEYYSEAIRRWERIVNEFPEYDRSPYVLFRAGRTYFGLGNYNQAVNAFQRMLNEYPGAANRQDAMLQIAQAYYNRGDMHEAISRYEDYLEEYPESDEISYVLDQIQVCFFRLGKSDAELEEFLQDYPLSRWASEIYWGVAADYFNEANYSAAQDYFKKIILDFPDSSYIEDAYFYNAECYFLKENYEEAIKAYDGGYIQNFPEHEDVPDAMFNLGLAYFNIEDYETSIEKYRQFISEFPEHELVENALRNIATINNRLNRTRDAVNAYKDIIERSPESERVPSLYLTIGELYENEGNYEKAIENYKKIEPEHREYTEARYFMGQSYEEVGSMEKAREVYESLEDYHQKDDQFRIAALFELAELVSRENPEKAREYYDDIINNTTNETWRERARRRREDLD